SPRARPTRCAPIPPSSRRTWGSPRQAPRRPAVAELATLPRLLLRNARELRTRAAIREKDRGIWQSYSWEDYHAQVRDFALGLAALGFKRGDRLSVIGDNRPRLYWAQVAAQCLGGVSVPVYQDSIAKELAFVWNHADVSVIVAEDQEQIDKVLGLREQFRVDDDYLAYLPMAWVGDAFYTLVMSLVVGFACNCPESPETVQRDLRELGPTLILAPPRIWENMLTAVQVKGADAPPLKRWVFDRFRGAAERAEILRSEG